VPRAGDGRGKTPNRTPADADAGEIRKAIPADAGDVVEPSRERRAWA